MRIKLLFLSLIIALSAAASGNKNLSPVKNDSHKADSIFDSVRQNYSHGKISADSVVSLAVYHKVWNPTLAENCLKLVIKENNPRCMMELGALYALSPEFFGRTSDGVKLLTAAAKAGYNDANGYLGLYYNNHNDYTKAKAYFDTWRPITYGFGYAGLGNMYANGKGVGKDLVKAREYYHQSALKGYPRGMALYGLNLHTGTGGEVDYPEAFFWLYMAGDLGDDASRTTLFLPRRNESFGDTQTGKTTGLVLQVIEALHYKQNIKDEPIYKDGFLASLKSREKAAEQGDDWARFYLGSMNYNGEFLNQNYAQALHYYEPIARKGQLPRSVLALVNERLAEMYRDGKGTKANPAKALHYARIAAQHGSLAAYKMVEQIP